MFYVLIRDYKVVFLFVAYHMFFVEDMLSAALYEQALSK